MQRLVHGLLDGEAHHGVHPLPALGQPLHDGQLLGTQNARGHTRAVPVRVFEIDPDAHPVAPGDQRDGEVLLVGDAGHEPRGQLRSAVGIGEHRSASHAELAQHVSEREPPADELDLAKPTQGSGVLPFVRVKPGQDGVTDSVRARRQVHRGEQPERQRHPECWGKRREREGIDHAPPLSLWDRARRTRACIGYTAGMSFSPQRAAAMALLLGVLPACSAEPLALPTVAAVTAQHDRSLDPPLYRALYDYSFLPETQASEQRVRILIWLHYMEFNRLQLGLLTELAEQVARERTAVTARQDAIIQQYAPQLNATYDAIWEGLLASTPAAQLDAMAPDLAPVHKREQELLALRGQSVRTLFDAQGPFLRTLTPVQEIRFTDATFLLRQRLDPYANPGDFTTLVGPVYVAGQFGALSKPTFDPNEDHLNIGGLWSPEPEKLTGPQYPSARREVLLYMVLLEPSLPEAVAAELTRRPKTEGVTPGMYVPPAGDGQPVPPAPAPPAGDGQPAGPGPGVPVPPAPGLPITPVKPVEPTPGVPEPPRPGRPDDPPSP